MAKEISPSILDCMWRKMRGHISMPQPHMIAVKLGRMGALSLPAGMGLSSANGLQPCNMSAVAGYLLSGGERRGTRAITLYDLVSIVPY